jgi:hypothetical protein
MILEMRIQQIEPFAHTKLTLPIGHIEYYVFAVQDKHTATLVQGRGSVRKVLQVHDLQNEQERYLSARYRMRK